MYSRSSNCGRFSPIFWRIFTPVNGSPGHINAIHAHYQGCLCHVRATTAANAFRQRLRIPAQVDARQKNNEHIIVFEVRGFYKINHAAFGPPFHEQKS